MAKSKTAQIEAKEPLSAERIQLAALELIEAEGLASFSTRKLATALHCEAMSIYHYFPSKGHLMDALVDRVMSELSVLAPDGRPWRKQVEASAREWRAMAHRYPNFFGYLALHRLNTPTALTWLNSVLAMFAVELGPERGARMFRAFGYYLNGAMLDETAGYSRGPSTVEPVPDAVMAERYPAVVKAGRWFAPAEWEKTFTDGLKMFLDGVERTTKR
jgi:AcrR family transcriptional regulator